MSDLMARLRSRGTFRNIDKTFTPDADCVEAADRIAALEAESAALLQVNRDNAQWFAALKADYDKLEAECARLREHIRTEFLAAEARRLFPCNKLAQAAHIAANLREPT